MRLALCILVGSCMLAGCDRAEEDSDEPAGTCESAVTNQDLHECFAFAARMADSVLLVVVDSTHRGVPDSVLADSAQQAWLAYRRAQCRSEAAYVEGGTMQPIAMLGCMTRMAEERTEELREQLKLP